MEIKAVRRIFLVPVLILLYGLFQCFRVVTSEHAYAHAGALAARFMLALSGAFFSVLSIAIALLAMAICRLSVTASRSSQNKLIAAFTFCRGIIPFIMLLIMICNGLGLVSLIAGEICWFVSVMHSGHGAGKILLMAVIAICGVLWMLLKSLVSIRRCFAFFKREESHIHGQAVDEQRSPLLWGWIRELAQKSQVVMPDNIVVGFFDCFYVTANNVRLNSGELLTGNTLYLPLTYSSLMDKEEVAAVIGHELGHFTGQDTQYSLRFAPVYAGLQNTLEQMANNSQGGTWIDRIVLHPALDTGLWFLIKFHETVSYWSRIREFAADATGARASTPQALASALLRISALSGIVDNYLNTVMSGKEAPPEWINGLLNEARQAEAFDVQACLENEIQHPTDSHPVTRARIEALHVSLDDRLLSRATRQVSEGDFESLSALFDGLEDVRTAMSQSLSEEAAKHNEERQRMLASQAELATEDAEFWRNLKKKVFFNCALTLLLAIAGIASLVVTSKGGLSTIFITLAWLLGFVTFRLNRLAKKPVYTFTPTHIQCTDLAGPIAWTAIRDFEVQERYQAIRIVLTWQAGYQPPKLVSRKTHGIEVPRFGNTFSLVIHTDMRKTLAGQQVTVSAVEVAGEFEQYLRAAYARQELRQN